MKNTFKRVTLNRFENDEFPLSIEVSGFKDTFGGLLNLCQLYDGGDDD